MMCGLGAATTGTTTGTGTGSVPAPGFTDGLKLWSSPSTAVSMLAAAAGNPSLAFSGPMAGFTIGILAVPLAAVLLVMGMSEETAGGHHR